MNSQSLKQPAVALAAQPEKDQAFLVTADHAIMAVLRAIDLVLKAFVVVACMVLIVVLISEAFARYFLHSSFGVSGEVSRLAFVWIIFLGIPLGVLRGRHVGIDLLPASLTPPMAAHVRRLGAVLSLGVIATVLWQTFDVMVFNWSQELNTISIGYGWFYLPIAIGLAISALQLVYVAIKGDNVLFRDRNEEGAL